MKCTIRRMVLMLWMLVSATLSAQNISVSSFKLLENDLTANTTGTMERDQNGEVAALIKVVTREKGFVFEGGMTGIAGTKQEAGEVWVYVPHGIKRITIRHNDLGVLRDYYFPIPIEKAKTYEMVLTTGRVETIVTQSVNKQFVVFNVKPADAIVELGDEILTVDSEGYATKSMPFGTYDYRVTCANYHTTAGKVTVNAQGKAEVNVTLRPNFGWIRLDGNSEYHGAFIYMDNERVGQLPFTTGNIKSGTHRIKVVKSLYKTYENEVTVQDDETTEVNVELIPNFATTTFVTDENSEIWVDGTRKGKGSWTGPMEIGEYTVEVRKGSHRTVSEVVQIHSVDDRTIQLKSPTPIYGTLELSSNPLRTTVFIDDEEVGETPLMLNNVLVGSRRVTFKKEGYNTIDKTIDVSENIENKVSADLTKPQNVQPVVTAQPSRVTGMVINAKDNGPVIGATIAVKDVPNMSVITDIDGKFVIAIPSSAKTLVVSYAGMATQEVTIHPNVEVYMSELPSLKKARTRVTLMFTAGYSSIYGMNYGGEIGLNLNGFSITTGVKNHMMGKYSIYENGVYIKEINYPIELLRFHTKLDYTISLGRWIGIAPQIGLVYGPSFYKGKEYILGEYPTIDWEAMIWVDKDYIAMNRKIMKFAEMRYGVVVGLAFKCHVVSTRRFGLDIGITPEYIFNEGFTANAGLAVRF